RLANALFVLNESKANVLVPILAKDNTRGYGDAGFPNEELGEFERAQMRVLVGNRRPGEHGGLGHRNVPAGASEAFNHHVAAVLVNLAHLFDDVVRAVEGGGSSHLNWRE